MAKFTLRQLLALTTLCAVWFATFNPEQLGVSVHIALGYLFVVGFLSANPYGLQFLGPVTCFISRSTTAACSLWWLFLITIIFQADTSREEHWEMFFVCVPYLTILISTLATAELVVNQSSRLHSSRSLWLLQVSIAVLVFGLSVWHLASADPPTNLSTDNTVLGTVLFNAAYLIAYIGQASWRKSLN